MKFKEIVSFSTIGLIFLFLVYIIQLPFSLILNENIYVYFLLLFMLPTCVSGIIMITSSSPKNIIKKIFYYGLVPIGFMLTISILIFKTIDKFLFGSR